MKHCVFIANGTVILFPLSYIKCVTINVETPQIETVNRKYVWYKHVNLKRNCHYLQKKFFYAHIRCHLKESEKGICSKTAMETLFAHLQVTQCSAESHITWEVWKEEETEILLIIMGDEKNNCDMRLQTSKDMPLYYKIFKQKWGRRASRSCGKYHIWNNGKLSNRGI